MNVNNLISQSLSVNSIAFSLFREHQQNDGRTGLITFIVHSGNGAVVSTDVTGSPALVEERERKEWFNGEKVSLAD
jgi:hypothetical protein